MTPVSTSTPSPPPTSLRTWLVRLIKLAVVVGALGWLVASGRLDSSVLRFDRQALPWLVAGALITLVPFLITFYRLSWMLRAMDCPLPLAEVVRIGFIGAFFNTFTLGSMGGDVVKVGYLVHATGQAARILACVLLDRVVALLAILSLGGVALLVAFGHVGDAASLQGLVLVTLLVLGGSAACGLVGVVAMARSRRAGLVVWAALVLSLGVALVVLAGQSPWALVEPAAPDALMRGRVAVVVAVDALAALGAALLLPACLPGGRLAHLVRHHLPLGESFMRFVDALLMVRHRLPLMLALWALSMLSQFITMLALFVLARSLPLDVMPSLVQIVAVAPLAMIINTVPVPGGGLGVGEAALATLLELWTVNGQVVTGGAGIFLIWRLWVVLWGLLGLPAFLARGRPGATEASP